PDRHPADEPATGRHGRAATEGKLKAMNGQAGFALRGRNRDVLTCIANLSNDEVFTPPARTTRSTGMGTCSGRPNRKRIVLPDDHIPSDGIWSLLFPRIRKRDAQNETILAEVWRWNKRWSGR